jgi:hypothetical protein
LSKVEELELDFSEEKCNLNPAFNSRFKRLAEGIEMGKLRVNDFISEIQYQLNWSMYFCMRIESRTLSMLGKQALYHLKQSPSPFVLEIGSCICFPWAGFELSILLSPALK